MSQERDDKVDAFGIVRADVGFDKLHPVRDIELLRHLPRRLDDIGSPVNANNLRIGVAKHMNEVKIERDREIRLAAPEVYGSE